VVMRGNGESIVNARIRLNNSSDKPLTTFNFEIPRMKVTELMGYQASLPQTCKRYDSTVNAKTQPDGKLPCLEYEETDLSYYDEVYVPENSEFNKLSFGGSEGSYTVTLPRPIQANHTSYLVLTYIGTGYVTKSLGVSTFSFESLKVGERIKQVQVAIDVDSDLVLDGQRARVNYVPGPTDSPEIAKGTVAANGASADSLRSFSNSIGQYGGLTKSAKNLAVGETLTVKGRYAESAWALNWTKVAIGVLILLAIVGLLVWWLRRFRRRAQADKPVPAAAGKVPVTDSLDHARHSLVNPAYVIAGFISALLITAATALLGWLTMYADSSVDSDPIITVLGGLMIIIFYVLAALGPAIWLASTRHDWRVLVYVLAWEFGWLVVFMAIYVLGFRNLVSPSPSPQPSPYINATM
jgi:hypothetical protein